MDIFEIFNIYRPLYNTPPAWKTKTYMPFKEVCECLETANIYAPIFGLNWSSKLTRLESYKYMYSYDVIPCEKYDSTFEVSCIYIQLWWTAPLTAKWSYLLNPMKSCFIIGSTYLVIPMTILLLWQIVSKPLLRYWFLLLYLQFVESLYWCVQYYLYHIQEDVFWNMTGSYLSNGNLSKQFSALIVFCDIICSYLCSFYDEVYDFWHMTWKMTKCSCAFYVLQRD